ncbi:MAG: hypothetical protein AB8H80_22265 [Planctomycetota bacterium]
MLVHRRTYADEARQGHGSTALEMWRSDNGLDWRMAAAPRTKGNCWGSITVDGDQLAVAWSANHGDAWRDTFFQRYDPVREAWVGEPTCLARGTGANDHYTPGSLVRTKTGALVAAIGSHRRPPGPVWKHAWSLGMRWLPPGDKQWQELQQVNVTNYGQGGNSLVHGDQVFMTFFSGPDRSVHSMRTFHAATGQFEQAANQPASAKAKDGAIVCGVAVCCTDATGGRTLIHLLGSTQPGQGRLCISYSREGIAPTTTFLAADPPLRSGATVPTNYTLARGTGNQVFAYFSKEAEKHANLWQCVIVQGKPLFEPKRVVAGVADQFKRLNGMRTMQAITGLHVVSSGPTAKHKHGAIGVYGSALARTAWIKQSR